MALDFCTARTIMTVIRIMAITKLLEIPNMAGSF